MPISASRCSGRPCAADRAAPADRRGLIAGRRQAGGRVEVLGVWEALDRQRVAANAAARTVATPGRVVRICPALSASSGSIWPSTSAMSALQRLASGRRSRAEPRGAQLGVGRRRQAAASSARPRTRRSRRSGGRRRAPCSDRGDGGRPANAAAQASTAWPVGAVERQRPAVPGRRRQARAERVELVVQSLLQRLVRERPAGGDGAPRASSASTPSRRAGRPGALARQPDQRRAVAVVGLEPPRAQAAPGRPGLRRREQPQRPRPAPLELAPPTPDATRRSPRSRTPDRRAAATDQPLELIHPVARAPAATPARRSARAHRSSATPG